MSETREIFEGEEVMEVTGGQALATIVGAEIDMQISTAKKYPRSVGLAKKRMLEMATLDQATAEKCGYALKRKDRDGSIVWIRGPSIRMAEIAACSWGNIRSGARITDIGEKFVTAQGVCHDLETNTSITMETQRRITTKHGKRFGDDMIGVTANAAGAIALRNAIFKIVPLAIIRPVYNEAMKVAEGDSKTFTQRRDACIDAFKKLKVAVEEIMAVLDKKGQGVEDINSEDLMNLRGLYVSIQDGEITVDAAFRPQGQGDAADQKSTLQERMDAAKNPPKLTPEQQASAEISRWEQIRQLKEAEDAKIAAAFYPPVAVALARLKEAEDEKIAAAGGANDGASPEQKSDADLPQAPPLLAQRDPTTPTPPPAAEPADPAMEAAIAVQWSDFVPELVRLAMSAPGTPLADGAAVAAAINGFVLKSRMVKKEDQIKPSERRRLYEAVATGRLLPGGTITPAK